MGVHLPAGLPVVACCSYTFKALGAGFYGLRKATDFRKTIMELIMEGGDADR